MENQEDKEIDGRPYRVDFSLLKGGSPFSAEPVYLTTRSDLIKMKTRVISDKERFEEDSDLADLLNTSEGVTYEEEQSGLLTLPQPFSPHRDDFESDESEFSDDNTEETDMSSDEEVAYLSRQSSVVLEKSPISDRKGNQTPVFPKTGHETPAIAKIRHHETPVIPKTENETPATSKFRNETPVKISKTENETPTLSKSENETPTFSNSGNETPTRTKLATRSSSLRGLPPKSNKTTTTQKIEDYVPEPNEKTPGKTLRTEFAKKPRANSVSRLIESIERSRIPPSLSGKPEIPIPGKPIVGKPEIPIPGKPIVGKPEIPGKPIVRPTIPKDQQKNLNMETPGTQNPGTQNPGTQNPGTQNPGTQIPGSPSLLHKTPGHSKSTEKHPTPQNLATVGRSLSKKTVVYTRDSSESSKIPDQSEKRPVIPTQNVGKRPPLQKTAAGGNLQKAISTPDPKRGLVRSPEKDISENRNSDSDSSDFSKPETLSPPSTSPLPRLNPRVDVVRSPLTRAKSEVSVKSTRQEAPLIQKMVQKIETSFNFPAPPEKETPDLRKFLSELAEYIRPILLIVKENLSEIQKWEYNDKIRFAANVTVQYMALIQFLRANQKILMKWIHLEISAEIEDHRKLAIGVLNLLAVLLNDPNAAEVEENYPKLMQQSREELLKFLQVIKGYAADF